MDLQQFADLTSSDFVSSGFNKDSYSNRDGHTHTDSFVFHSLLHYRHEHRQVS